MQRKERLLSELSDDLPIDVLPFTNGEYLPHPATPRQEAIMALQNEKVEEYRRRFGMSRRSFVRSAAAMTIGIWSIGQISNGRFGHYAFGEEYEYNPYDAQGRGHQKSAKMADLNWPGAQLANLPGEFIIDLQSHHLDSGGDWRLRNPRSHLIHAALWSQGTTGNLADRFDDQGDPRGLGQGGEPDPIENLGRMHYFKELFLDAPNSMTCLSAVPSAPDDQPLSVDEAARTVNMVNALANNTPRAMLHAFVMPNRGSLGKRSDGTHQPVFMNEEFEMMERHVISHPMLKGWKTYCPYGDVSGQSGWWLDGEIGTAFLEQVRRLGDKYGIPKTVATHKGFWLPGFDQECASPRDVGPAALRFPDVAFVVYHSGYNSGREAAYPGDEQVEHSNTVNSLIKSLHENGLGADQNIPPGLQHGNSPNVWAELGSVWANHMSDPDGAAHLLGKLFTYVGTQRVCWGTDALWRGSPQPEIATFRAFEFSEEARVLYNLPHGMEGDRFDPRYNAQDPASYRNPHPSIPDWPTDGVAHPERTLRNGVFGRNVAEQYGVDPDAHREKINADDVQAMRDQYILNPMTPRATTPFRFNGDIPLRTPSDVWADRAGKPWAP
jgi:uncharacterized protein